jgi:CMP-N-acetylneuraminic acid synthetase
LDFWGHPLIAYNIAKARKVGLFNDIVVSTEDSEISEAAIKYGASVPFKRPAHLSRDPATIVDVCLHALDQMEQQRGRPYEVITVLLATSPLVLMRDISAAFSLFHERGAEHSLLSMCQTEEPPFSSQFVDTASGTIEPCFPESQWSSKKSTECPLAYHSNGCVAVANVETLRRVKSLYAKDTTAYIMPRRRSIDIDTMDDFLTARALYHSDDIEKDEGLFDE